MPPRSYELEKLYRSIAMLTPGQPALTREKALDLLTELTVVQSRLDRLRTSLRELVDGLDQPGDSGGSSP